jgi:type 1 glutamine amidotransferase
MENKTVSRGFRIPIDIHRKLKKWAKDRSQPMNLIVVHMLQSQIELEEKKKLSVIKR